MNNEPPKRLATPKLMTKAEQDEAARQREAARLGRVAHHHGKTADACPYPEGNPLRQLWLDNLAKPIRSRLDMSAARARGHAAFHDGLELHECPLPSRSAESSEWHEGYEDARAWHEKDQTDRFR